QGFAGEAFNFGNETPLSVLEVVDRILARMGRPDLTPIVLNEATHEIPRQYLDCGKARRLLDWRPRWSFDEGLDEAIGWYRGHLGESSPTGIRAPRAAETAQEEMRRKPADRSS